MNTKWTNQESSRLISSRETMRHDRRSHLYAILTGLALVGAGVAFSNSLKCDDAVVKDYPPVTLHSGETVTELVSESLDDIAETYDINRSYLNGTYAAQHAATEMKKEKNEKYNMPGEAYKIEVYTNDWGEKQVSVEPIIDTTS